MFRSFLRWLDRAPIDDPVDRRNARVMQGLLLFLGTTIPATIAFAVAVTWSELFSRTTPWATLASLGMSLSLGGIAWLGLWLVRRGALALAVKLLIGAMLIISAVNLGTNGLQRQIPDQLGQMLVLVLSGLVLGRRALWISLAVLMASAVLGAARDAAGLFADAPGRAFYNLPPLLFTYFLVAVLIDRTTEALRESLRESNERGRQLLAEMRERERTHAQLIHAQKREITEQMASGMAHDFNNIFAVVIGFANQRHEDAGESTAERLSLLEGYLSDVEEAARRGMSVSRRLLRFNRRDGDQPVVFDAVQAVRELAPMLRQLLGTRIVLSVDSAIESAWVRMDRSQFELMLLNIASNARDALAGQGRFDINILHMDSTVQIQLRDNGCGMHSDVAAKVFEPFFSTKPADSGTGLGLAVVHELVTTAGGSIRLQSALGAGSTFTINLPRVRPDPECSPGHEPP